MTNVAFEVHDGYIGITASGHSGYASSGSDIVCAGVSTMLCSWRNVCEELAEDEKITIMEDLIEDGYMSLAIYDPNDYTKLCFSMVKYALEEIGEQYPANLCVEWDESE